MNVKIIKLNTDTPTDSYPLYISRVAAGFPSPADDYIECPLNLHEYLINQPSSTFFAKAQGESMQGLGIFCGDLLIVDRAVDAVHGDIVIAAIHGELTCKTLDQHKRLLLSANPDYPPIKIPEDADLIIEGVVIHSVRHHRNL